MTHLLVMNDTSPEIAERVREMLMARSGSERVLMGSRMFDFARAMILASFPSELSDLEIKRRLCERVYGDEVQAAAFAEHLRSNVTGERNLNWKFPVSTASLKKD